MLAVFRAIHGFKETLERVALLPEVDIEAFQVFEGWVSNLKLSEFKELDWLFDYGSPVFEGLDWPLLCKFFFLQTIFRRRGLKNHFVRLWSPNGTRIESYHFRSYQLYTKIPCPVHLCGDYGSLRLYDT